jgi:hypothetical protein
MGVSLPPPYACREQIAFGIFEYGGDFDNLENAMGEAIDRSGPVRAPCHGGRLGNYKLVSRVASVV